MAIGTFPDEPNRRRVIVVLRQHKIEELEYKTGGSRTLLDKESYVLPIGEDLQLPKDLRRNLSPVLENLIKADLLRPGALLVQSPYSMDEYVNLEQANQRFAVGKFLCFSELCMHLGAKEVRVLQIEYSDASSRITVDGKAEGSHGSVTVEAKTAVALEKALKLKTEISLIDTFEGKEPNIQGAEDLLTRSGLWSDSQMKALVDIRRGSNKLSTRTLKLSHMSEARSNLSVAADLALDIGPASLSIGVRVSKEEVLKQDCILTVSVKF